MGNEPQIWRIHIRPKSAKPGVDSTKFCLKKAIIGIGWKIDSNPHSEEEYLRSGKKSHDSRSWRKATNAILRNMKIGDLIWFRDSWGKYYLGRIESDWEYRDGQDYIDADILNIRKVDAYYVDTIIPGKIVNNFVSGTVVQRILDGPSKSFSFLKYNSLTNTKTYYTPEILDKNDIFSLLSSIDLEDLVGIYLQKTLGYILIPSTRSTRNDTIKIEYALKSKDGSHVVGVQVKSGDTKIDLNEYADYDYKVYVFSPAGYVGTHNNNTDKIEKSDLLNFLFKRKNFMPEHIQDWINYISRSRTLSKKV